MTAHLRKRSVSLAGHRTSVALERQFWAVLEDAAARGGETMAALVTRVDGARDHSHPLASALRIEALRCAGAVKRS